MKVLVDINIQRIDRTVLCDNKVLQQLTQATFLLLCSRKDTLSEQSLVNMKTFIVLKDLHAELLGLTMLEFFDYLSDNV